MEDGLTLGRASLLGAEVVTMRAVRVAVAARVVPNIACSKCCRQDGVAFAVLVERSLGAEDVAVQAVRVGVAVQDGGCRSAEQHHVDAPRQRLALHPAPLLAAKTAAPQPSAAQQQPMSWGLVQRVRMSMWRKTPCIMHEHEQVVKAKCRAATKCRTALRTFTHSAKDSTAYAAKGGTSDILSFTSVVQFCRNAACLVLSLIQSCCMPELQAIRASHDRG